MNFPNVGPNDFSMLIIGDIHNMGHNPVSRLDYFPNAIMKKIEELVDFSNQRNVDIMGFLGDLSHSPESAYATLGRLGKALKKANCRKIVIAGNHDIHGGNIETTYRCGLGLIKDLDVLELIENEETIFFEKGNQKIQLTGQSYHFDIDTRDSKLDYCRTKAEGVTTAIHLVHGYLTNKALLFNHTLVSDIQDHTEVDYTFSGHYHTNFEVVAPNGQVFANPGALGRITKSKSEMRQPFVYYLVIKEDGTRFLEKYYIQCAAPAEEILKQDTLEDDIVEVFEMESFISSIHDVTRVKTLDAEVIVNKIAMDQNIPNEIRLDVLEEIAFAKEEIDKLQKDVDYFQNEDEEEVLE